MTQTPSPPATPEFGYVTPGGPTHTYPGTAPVSIRKFSFGPYDNNVYVLRSGDEAFIIDAAAPPDRLQPELEGARVTGLAITHSHPDHTQALQELRDTFNMPVYVNRKDSWRGEMSFVDDGDAVAFGDVRLAISHTPGHTPGSMCLSMPGFLFSGDTLFPGGPGNTGSDAARFEQVMASLDSLFKAPDETRVLPGHGLDTTIGRERGYVEVWRARGW